MLVYFENIGADIVEEIAVVSDHEDGHLRVVEKIFEPFYHFEVEVVGWLVEKNQIGLGNEHIGKCKTLLLSTRKLFDWLFEIVDIEFSKDLLNAYFIVPCIEAVHVGHSKLNLVAICWVVGMFLYEIFVMSNSFYYIIVRGKASLAHGHSRLEIWVLSEATNADVATIGDSATIL